LCCGLNDAVVLKHAVSAYKELSDCYSSDQRTRLRERGKKKSNFLRVSDRMQKVRQFSDSEKYSTRVWKRSTGHRIA
jgi:hypothetical protein